jgi:hypothetical protein
LIGITLDEQFLENVHQNVQGCFQDDPHLIPEVLWLIMDKKPTPPTTQQSNTLLKLILLLITHTQEKNLANTIKITNQLASEIAKTNHDQKQNVINELLDTILNAPTALEDKSPWNTTIESLCAALQLQATIESPQQACDIFVGIVQHESLSLKSKKVLLLSFFGTTEHKAACCFMPSSQNKLTFMAVLFTQLENAGEQQFDILADIFAKTVFAIADENKDEFTQSLHKTNFLERASKSTHPKVLDLALSLYEKGQQLDGTFHIDADIFKPLWLMDILSNPHFSLEKKRQTIQVLLSNQSDESIKKIIFDYYQVGSEQDTPIWQCVFFRLVELHKDCIEELLIFLQALPSYPSICRLLWSNANLIDDACSAANYEKLIPCTIATYNACIIDTDQKTALPLSRNPNKDNSWEWCQTMFNDETKICTSTIINLLSFLFDKKPLELVVCILFPHRKYAEETLFYRLMHDDDGSIARFIHNYIMDYQHEKDFAELWQHYVYASLRALKTNIASYELRDDGSYAAPPALQLLPPEEWVEAFYNLSSNSKRNQTLDPGKLQPETLHNANGESFPKIALPYLLLALGMYFKDHTSRFTYANRAEAFIDNVRVLLGSKQAQLSENNFSNSPFNNLYQQLPKTALPKEGRKQTFTFLYEFCLKESNNPDNASKEKFKQLVLQPLTKRLKSLFTTDKATLKVSSSSHAFDDKDETVGAAASSSAVAAAPETPTQTVYGKNGSGERQVHFEMTQVIKGKTPGEAAHKAVK